MPSCPNCLSTHLEEEMYLGSKTGDYKCLQCKFTDHNSVFKDHTLYEKYSEKPVQNKKYVVEGDLSSEKTRDNYPTKVLCDECAGNYTIIHEEGETKESCEDC